MGLDLFAFFMRDQAVFINKVTPSVGLYVHSVQFTNVFASFLLSVHTSALSVALIGRTLLSTAIGFRSKLRFPAKAVISGKVGCSF